MPFAKQRKLTVKRLKELLRYNARTGIFIRKKRQGRCAKGSVAGSIREDGYVVLYVDGERFYAHQFVFLYKREYVFLGELDHKDGNPSNNRWKNIRPATRSQNISNSKIRKNNKFGLKGVKVVDRPSYKGFSSAICVRGKRHHLGYFKKAVDAHKIYVAKAKELHKEFARVR